MHKIPLAAFRGNRFNILFYDAAGVYFLKSHMKLPHSGPLNQLLQAVLADLGVSHYVAGCKALDIIDKAITWRHLNSLFRFTPEWKQNLINGVKMLRLMESEDLSFLDVTYSDDEVSQDLSRPSELNCIVQEAVIRSFTRRRISFRVLSSSDLRD